MKSCDYYQKCEILNENGTEMPKLANLFKERYCMGQFDQCARYQVARFAGLKQVPQFMLPSQVEWAAQIIRERKSEPKNAVISQISFSQSSQ